ncbi:4Fe-4S dicluster domain-containing protein [Shewanella sp. NIFS-20-20]|uniref:4Fe-4S dicluster domain-containing protein n=1 Tax=Shewanella sp. NIFS-20-20 TaxID=2853806 RepID=UPI001C461C0E|nr:4Fe-4S dicluster domain-containing protein [Shewanella sp. NIFS-20-20]MBV7316668.1 4Fe-4S dicluster domain-containing protein [Shewanella sp. NIFS-20-20]
MQKSKRMFLKGAGALAFGMSIYRMTGVSHAANPGLIERLVLIHDENKCIGCDACSQACRETNQVPEGVSRLTIKRHGPYGEYPNQSYRFERISCQHCENAPCVKVCPTGAAYRDEATGVIRVNEWKCVGCLYCIAACPYKVRFIHPKTKAADKCDFCLETKLKLGELPACVQACPTQALVFGDSNDPTSEVSHIIKTVAVNRDKEALGTRPKVFKIMAANGEVLI